MTDDNAFQQNVFKRVTTMIYCIKNKIIRVTINTVKLLNTYYSILLN